jgi:hypothetical protein
MELQQKMRQKMRQKQRPKQHFSIERKRPHIQQGLDTLKKNVFFFCIQCKYKRNKRNIRNVFLACPPNGHV